MAKKKTRRRYYPRKKKRRRAKRKLPLLPIVGVIATPAVTQTIQAAMAGDFARIPTKLGYLVGLNDSGKFESRILIENMVPIVAGVAGHKIANMLGINRIFNNLPSPLNKLAL